MYNIYTCVDFTKHKITPSNFSARDVNCFIIYLQILFIYKSCKSNIYAQNLLNTVQSVQERNVF